MIVTAGGVGYVLRVSLATLEGIRHKPGEVSLYVHTAVKEDAIDLYGFLSQEELAFFKQLLEVSGVGPKTALGVLNVSDIGSLKRSIAAGDATALTKVFGIGKKSAERIVVELRDKLAKESPISLAGVAGGSDAEVIEALMALGYSAPESRAALKSAPGENTRERLAAALKHLGTPTP